MSSQLFLDYTPPTSSSFIYFWVASELFNKWRSGMPLLFSTITFGPTLGPPTLWITPLILHLCRFSSTVSVRHINTHFSRLYSLRIVHIVILHASNICKFQGPLFAHSCTNSTAFILKSDILYIFLILAWNSVNFFSLYFIVMLIIIVMHQTSRLFPCTLLLVSHLV